MHNNPVAVCDGGDMLGVLGKSLDRISRSDNHRFQASVILFWKPFALTLSQIISLGFNSEVLGKKGNDERVKPKHVCSLNLRR